MSYQSTNEIRLLAIGITRNSGFMLKKNLKSLLKLRKKFKKFDFFIYENDSTDGTTEFLKEMAEKHEGFSFFSEHIDEEKRSRIFTAQDEYGKPCRIELITYARNKLLELIKPAANKYDYILNIDLDILFQNTNQIASTFMRFKDKDFDCVSGCGMTKWLRYRDAYAFRSLDFPFGPEFLGTYWWQTTMHQIQKRYKRGLCIPVLSAFGGAAIYKSEAYVSSIYDCHCDEEFIRLHEKLDKTIAGVDQIEHCSNVPVPNTGYSKPIICEHVTFHYKMRAQGFDKFFVDTSWRFIFKD